MYDNVNNINGGRELPADSYTPPISLIKDVKFGAKNINLRVVILFLGKTVMTKSGQVVCTCRIADSSGSVDLSLWDDLSKLLRPGDVIYMNNAYATGFKGRLSINVGRGGYIEKIDEFCFMFEEVPYFSEAPLDSSVLNSTNNVATSSISSKHHSTQMNTPTRDFKEFNNGSMDPRKVSASHGTPSISTPNYKSSVTSSNNIGKYRNTSANSDAIANARSTNSNKNYEHTSIVTGSASTSNTSSRTENKFIPRDPRLRH